MNDTETQLISASTSGIYNNRKSIVTSNGEKWSAQVNIQSLTNNVICINFMGEAFRNMESPYVIP